ncbi:hypothetical protein KUTeg_021970 [Tegillarca granosa]|uniref:Uncharacterized protein n=1 Tax=Tegillarca granosa TaxID=220873 RepID=A0ABQ9E7S8_TEGGR|nr:hypothetical protein KUTeg_021970 [Tegillarca granosa]
MSKSKPGPSSYFESSYFLHQRYEDTSLLIFQQQQQANGSHVEYGNYGSKGVIAKPETVSNMKVDINRVESSVCEIL